MVHVERLIVDSSMLNLDGVSCCMRKWWMAFGVMLVLVGILVSSWSNSFKELTEIELVNEAEDGFEVSGNFTAGEKLYVKWEEPDWEILRNGEYVVYYLTVIGPQPEDGETNFTVKLYSPPKKGANVTVSSRGGGLNSCFTGQTFPGGIVQYSGEYVARLDEIARWYYRGSSPGRGSPPGYISLYTEVVRREYPHRSVLPVGIVLMVVGVPLAVWAAKSSQKDGTTRNRR